MSLIWKFTLLGVRFSASAYSQMSIAIAAAMSMSFNCPKSLLFMIRFARFVLLVLVLPGVLLLVCVRV